MEKHMLNHRMGRNCRQAKSGCMTLEPKGMELGYVGNPNNISNGQTIPGLKMAPKTSELSEYQNLVTRIYSSKEGKNFARRTNGLDGKGSSKKRRPVCNG